MAKKADGVVEAAHLSPEGDLLWVRVYERRGPTWSDLVILDKQMLIERLQKGKRFFIGQRNEQLASEFTLGPQILLQKGKSGNEIILGDLTESFKDGKAAFPLV